MAHIPFHVVAPFTDLSIHETEQPQRNLVADADIGTARETFFMNQVGSVCSLTYPKRGDFLVDGKYLFEIGGKGKGFSQIKDIPNSYVVNDDTDVGIGNKIPLWLFGFMY